jgi:DNA-binding CsgD family transcriptional regulator
LTRATDAQALRESALKLLAQASDAEATATFRVVGSGSNKVMTGVEVAGDATLRRLLKSFDGGPAPSGSVASDDPTTASARRGTWRLDAPRPQAINRFDDSNRDYARPIESYEHLDAVQRWRKPGRIAQEVRMLAFEGDLFVGWLGALRCGRKPFTVEQRARMDRLAPRVHRLMVQAHSLERIDGEAHVILGEDGELEGATHSAERWLSRARLELLRRSVSMGQTLVVDGVQVDALPLLGGDRRRHLVRLLARPSVRIMRAELAPRQQDIARLAADGLTVAHIAHRLGLSPNTVKWHLKALYEVLGVRNRLELFRALREPS